MNVIFQINGGIGKCVMATAVCEGLKKKYPDANLIVVSGYPDVFINNPHVLKSLAFHQTAYFYRDFIQGHAFEVFAHDPYLTTGHIKQDEHLIQTWFKLFGLEYKGEKPRIYLNERELMYYRSKIQTDKPLIIMQTNGGAENQASKYSWARDIPAHVIMRVIEHFAPTHNILHIRRDDQPSFPNTFQLKDEFRAIAAILPLAEARLFMDSFAQHTAKAFDVPATVLWVANKPNVFGYDIHDNIESNPFTVEPDLRNSYLGRFNIQGDPLEFPYRNEDEIFAVEPIINSIAQQIETSRKVQAGK